MNCAALCDIYARYGDKGSVLDPIQGSDRGALEACCWYLYKLAEQGELVRRYQGFEPGKVPTATYFEALLSPGDFLRAKALLEMAVNMGFGREIKPEGEEVDLGLIELEKKTAPA